MVEAFVQFIFDNQLFQEEDRILLAISGGMDSILLSHLFQQPGFSFGIAHCNFQLRGEASELDAEFVEEWARKLKVPFYKKCFDTLALAEERKVSIQLLARDLRYEWLEEIRVKEGFRYIATAHHLNDAIETVIYNYTKGCGLRGLHGIPLRNGSIIRPLLFATKAEIENYCQSNQISFREDESNKTTKYSRNKIRHEVVPVLKELNPSFEKTAQKNILRIQETEAIFDWALEQIKEVVLEEKKGIFKINLDLLQNYPSLPTILFELLSPYGFSSEQINQLLPIESHQSGITFYSHTHQLLLDRSFLFVKPTDEKKQEVHLILGPNCKLDLETENFSIKLIEEDKIKINPDPNVAQFDQDKITFPLHLRHWEKGDYFCPLGMKGKRQKLQDFFTNNKLSRFEKEKIWILETAKKEICWIVGQRMDERFKVGKNTNVYLEIKYQKHRENG